METLNKVESLHDRRQSDIPLSQEQQEILLQLQRDILETVATSHDHDDNLQKLCLAAEAILPNAAASIMLFNDDRSSLSVRAAPSVPQEGIDALNGLVPGPTAGSCGTAVFTQVPVFVEHTLTDTRWSHQDFQNFATRFNIQACWSMPIRQPSQEVLGSFALSSFQSRAPTEFQKKLMSIGANLAAVILQREKMEKRLWDMAHYDSLTLLPNRSLLEKTLDQVLSQTKQNDEKLFLMFIDLDNFKNINDSYGHTIGDEALIITANTLRQCIREQDVLGRLGGDEFVLIIRDIAQHSDAITVADKILTELNSLPALEGTNTSLSASIGISVYPDDTDDKSELLRNADTAMYQSKNNGRNQYSFYQKEYTEQIRQQLEIEAELKRALVNDEFVVFYQPQVDAVSKKVMAAEALIRWQHPEKGLLSPFSFIPIAEKSNLIVDIGNWVLRQTCLDGAKWLASSISFDRLSVNLSVRQISKNFHQHVLTILDETKFPADKLELEITETLLMDTDAHAIIELKQLQNAGISIAIDDFGTGYSSLHQVRQLPLNKLKIDREFVKELPTNEDDVVLTRMIIAMAKALSLNIVAEGIETNEQQAFLQQEGCELLQGYLFGKPMPANEIEQQFKRLD